MWEIDLDTRNACWGLSNVRRCKLSAIWTEKVEHGTEKVEHSLSASAEGSHYTAPPTSPPIMLPL